MVLSNVTKFHKILIKNIRVREPMSSGQTYIITYVRTDRGNTKCPGHYHAGGIVKAKHSSRHKGSCMLKGYVH